MLVFHLACPFGVSVIRGNSYAQNLEHSLSKRGEKRAQAKVLGGLPEALYEKPRPGRAVTKLTGDVEAHLVALACSDAPEGYERWTLRLLAERLVALELVDSISHTAVAKKLKK